MSNQARRFDIRKGRQIGRQAQRISREGQQSSRQVRRMSNKARRFDNWEGRQSSRQAQILDTVETIDAIVTIDTTDTMGTIDIIHKINMGELSSMGKLFGTDGVRGVANTELSAELAFRLGQASAVVLAAETKHKPIILLGKDTRVSCDMLEGALAAGICSAGASVMSLGVIPTPAVAYLTKKYNADAGAVISASHNSFEFNGIKLFGSGGYKLADEVENKIEEFLECGLDKLEMPVGDGVGRYYLCDSAKRDYMEYLKTLCRVDLSGLTIALDCANGASFKIAPTIFQELGAKVHVVGDMPDGININRDCGSTHMEGLLKLTAASGADIGFAFDGDADRALAADEKGRLVDGDSLLALIGMDLKEKGLLSDDTVVATVMSNMGLEIAFKEAGITLKRTAVGDRYVLEEMLKHSHKLGGEQSGHIICTDFNTTGDGIATAIMTINALVASKRKFSDITNAVKVLPQVLRNARVQNENKERCFDDCVIKNMCDNLEEEFEGCGRVLIRPSGTEPLVRVMIEAMDIDIITRKAEELVKVIEEKLG